MGGEMELHAANHGFAWTSCSKGKCVDAGAARRRRPLARRNPARPLIKEKYEVHLARTKAEALNLSRAHHFDLYVFDIGLPDGTGSSWPASCRRGR